MNGARLYWARMSAAMPLKASCPFEGSFSRNVDMMSCSGAYLGAQHAVPVSRVKVIKQQVG